MAHPHPPDALREAHVPVSGCPRRKCASVLGLECAQSLHCFPRCRAIPPSGKLRIEAPKHFVALGPFGVSEFQDTPRPDKRPAAALRLVPSLMLLVAHPLRNALTGKVCKNLGYSPRTSVMTSWQWVDIRQAAWMRTPWRFAAYARQYQYTCSICRASSGWRRKCRPVVRRESARVMPGSTMRGRVILRRWKRMPCRMESS